MIDQGPTCFKRTQPDASTELIAHACYSSLLSSGSDSTCAGTPFRYAETDEVVIRLVPPERPARSTKLVLRNTRDHAIEISREKCGSQDVFGLDSGDVIDTWCPVCTCKADPENRGCAPQPECGICQDAELALLQPGETFEFEWDQRLLYRIAKVCSVRYTLQPRDTVNMRACFRDPAADKVQCSTKRVSGSSDVVMFEP